MTVPNQISLEDLLELLDLEELPSRSARHRVFCGRPQTEPADRVFGGLLLGQAVVAAGRTVPGEHHPVSLQAEFLQGVPTTAPLRWEVDPLGQTRSMSVRRATLRADSGDELFTAITRWGLERADLASIEDTVPRPVPEPESLPDLEDRFAGDARVPAWWRMRRPVQFRHTEDPPYTEPADRPGNTQSVWVRSRGPLPPEPALRAAVLAYVTDMSILESAFRAGGSMRHGPSSRLLSLSHTLAFHAGADLSTWHQFDASCRTVAHGRAVGVGEIFDGTGRHVASATQLGLVKFSPAPS
jgi:acyl-CoA thioesterase-2